MDLSIVIVNYRSRAKLLNCLASLRAAEPGGVRWEIIVVDNHSGDDLSEVGQRYPDVRLIMSPANRGMGAGNNLGIKAAAGEFILVLNPDTVVRGRAIPDMLDYLKSHASVGLVGPKLLYPDGSLQMSCARFPGFFIPILRRTFLGDYFAASRDSFTMNDFDHDSLRPVDWLMGSCLMFKREIGLADGGVFWPRFDERYFMYFEDIDLARQFWEHELQAVYDPAAIVTHDHQRESARHPWYLALLVDAITWHHIASWLKYFGKWGFKTKNYVQD